VGGGYRRLNISTFLQEGKTRMTTATTLSPATLRASLPAIYEIGLFHAGDDDMAQTEEAMAVLGVRTPGMLRQIVDTPIGLPEISFIANFDETTRIVWKPAADATLGDVGLMAVALLDLLARVAYFADDERPILTIEDAREDRGEGPEPADLEWFATQDIVGWQKVTDWHTNAFHLTGGMFEADSTGVVIRLYSES
jgi:hypothetical protein